MKIGVIGAGIAGLASAIRLARLGHKVVVYEQNAQAGGKLSSIEMTGFRFDMTPALLTLPEWIDELFTLCDKDPRDYIKYKPLEILAKYQWEDGTSFIAHSDKNKLIKEIQRKFSVNNNIMHRAFQHNKRKFELAQQFFFDKSIHRTSAYFSSSAAQALIHAGRFELFRTMNSSNTRLYEHPKLVQIFNQFASECGASPYKASAQLNYLQYVNFGIGGVFPEGGTVSISKALFKLAKEMGVSFNFDSPVEEILVEQKRIVGLKVGGFNELCNAVVSNMDTYYTYRKLLPDTPHPNDELKKTRSSSAILFYWGIGREFPDLQLHNTFYSDDGKMEYDSMFQKNNVYFDPSTYIYISKKFNAGDAPVGCENWVVRINVPHNNGQDWDGIIRRAKENVITKLSRMLKTNLRPLILCEQIIEPRTFETKMSNYQGALYGTSGNGKLAAFSKHPNFSKNIKGLYFCGASVHPGGTIPLCLKSAKIVTDLIGK